MTCFVDDEIPQLGWSQRVVDVLPNIRVPADDVDLLTAEFPHDVFHTHSAHADASTNGIDFLVVRQDGDLRAVTRLARDTFNLDGLVRDFRHFKLEKFADEIGMAAGKNDLRAVQSVFDAQCIRANAVAGLVFLRGHTLPAGHDAFNFSEINDHITALEAAHGAGFLSGGQGWLPVIPGLAEHFHVYAIDSLGFGPGDPIEQPYSFAYLVDHIREFQ